MDFLTSILTSSIVSVILISIFKDSFKAKLDMVKAEIDAIRKNRALDYDLTGKSIKSIWGELANIDDYIRHGVAHDIDNGSLNNLPLRPFILAINKEMALLPKQIHNQTSMCLTNLSTAWQAFAKGVHDEASLGREGKKTNEECVASVNKHLSELRESFKGELSGLRDAYRDYIDSHTENT